MKPRKLRYFSLPSLQWAKALVAALDVARSNVVLIPEYPFEEDDRSLGAFRTRGGRYIVRAKRDVVTAIAWSAFLQAYITKSHFGYGEMHHRLPPGSRKVFPLPPEKEDRSC